MIEGLLAYLTVTDLETVADNELALILEAILTFPVEMADPELDRLRQEVAAQLDAATPDRDALSSLGESYPTLLPASLKALDDAFDEFDQLLDEISHDDADSPRLARLEAALELLEEGSDWEGRAQAARALGELEEEVHQARQAYLAQPMTLSQVSSGSLVAHRCLLEGWSCWQEAFRAVHRGQTGEAFELAFDGNRLLAAVVVWAQRVASPE